MTAPRPVVAGRTYLITRRCTQRQFLLRPDDRVTQLYSYCLGEAAQRFHITLHGWTPMSNHHHMVIRDNQGNYPEFLAHLHKLLAQGLNAHWGRWENLWAAEQPNVVHLLDAAARFEKLVYVLANPVADHLVERVADWPGASSLRLHLSNKSQTVERPSWFFRDDGPMPETVTLRAERMEGFEDLSHREWSKLLENALREKEAAAALDRRDKKLRVFGRKNVLRAQHTDQPSTVETRRGLRPTVACRNAEARKYALELLDLFRDAYRDARSLWCAGDRDVVFPFGTYRMRVFGIRCEPDERNVSVAS